MSDTQDVNINPQLQCSVPQVQPKIEQDKEYYFPSDKSHFVPNSVTLTV